MTLLVTSVLGDTQAELIAGAEAAWDAGTEAVELRIDTLETDLVELAGYLKTHSDRTWVVTCRRAEEGGHFRGDTMERVSRLIAAARGTGAYVDFELADWRRSDNIRRKVRLAAAASDDASKHLILSTHDHTGPPVDLDALIEQMFSAGEGVIAKVAYHGRDISDSFVALDLVHKHGPAVIAVCMGEDGLWSRVLAKKFRAFATFAAPTPQTATAPGQATLDEMVNLYRWDAIAPSTRVYGVIGDPVAHSLSPLLFNRWFARAALDAVYLPLRVRADGNALPRFLDACMERPWLDLGGFSITIPHKQAALQWAGGATDSLTRTIGAANTLCFRDGKVAAYNTDCYAAVGSLVDAMGRSKSASQNPCGTGFQPVGLSGFRMHSKTDLIGLPVDVLGAGGVARAVLEGLQEFGCRVTIYGRSPDDTRRLADDFGFAAAAWEDRVRRTGKVLVNCTSVGMWPDTTASPMPPDSLGGCGLVFDLIYRPLETALLRDASAAGCKTLNGLAMFVRQAAMQFELWTSQTPDTREAHGFLTRELAARSQQSVEEGPLPRVAPASSR